MPDWPRLEATGAWSPVRAWGFHMHIRYGFDVALDLAQPATILTMMDVHSDFRRGIVEERELEVEIGRAHV